MSQVREMRMPRIAPLTLVIVTFCTSAYGRIIRVAQNGPADFATIQAAIDDANDGDTVIVASGTYTGDGNRDIDFKGKAITVKSEAGSGTCVIDCAGSIAEPHRGFYFHNAEDANALVQGFTITRGCVLRRNRFESEPGGAVSCAGSSPRISDCIIRGNSAASGGGIACWASDAILANCIITANKADDQVPPGVGDVRGSGGGILITGSHPVLVNCIITGNRAGQQGGAIWCEGSFTILNCTICGNQAGSGGGIYLHGRQSDAGILRNCIFWANAGRGCAQIANYSSGVLGTTHLEITYCTIQGGDQANCLWRVDGSWSSVDPLFANAGHWDPNGTPDKPYDDFWVEGDYHLKSQAGRWEPVSRSWAKDDVTSPCIDAGDPNSPVGAEPFPNGGRIDMGAYGGTVEASKSPSGVSARYGGGAGEPNEPFLIYTAEQFKAIGANPDDWDRHFKLMADIDLGGSDANDVRTIGYWRSWTDYKPFRGSLDGNGHRILHFTWRSTGQDRVGLFGYIAGASSYLKPVPTIKDLGLIDPNVEVGTGDDVGALVGFFVNASFSGCYVEGGRVSGDKHVGGLMGGTADCIMLSSIPRLDIRNCRATTKVSGTEAVGGLIGYYGGVTWRPTPPCGTYYEISNCCATGEVTGTAQVGGLAGFVDGGHVFDCYSRSHVRGGHLVGGLMGVSHADVATCYAAGKVEGAAEAGGLIGSISAADIIPEIEEPVRTSNSFWDIEASSQTASAAGTGKSTAEMQTACTFLDAGWDFVGESTNGTADTWQIAEGHDYPRLSWESVTEPEVGGD